MNRIFKIALLGLISGLSLTSCHKDDTTPSFPITPYAEQYPVDIANIDKFLDEYHMDVSSNNDATFTKLPSPNTTPHITSIREEFITPFPITDRTKTITRDGIDYKIYYIPFDGGSGQKPSRVDSVLVAYKGEYIYKKTDQTTTPSSTYISSAQFDQAQNPTWFALTGVVEGWKEIIPLFKSSSSATQNSDGTISYNGYGAGVMFLPSAFAYYNRAVGTIPSYSPLIFSFKLMGLNYVDSDYDRIDSKDEDINGNGILTDDDTDGDGNPNYLDQDDDGDGYFTKYEIANPLGGYYSFANIPDCAGNSPATGTKRHLDKNCHQP